MKIVAIEDLIQMMEQFVSGEGISTRDAERLESRLRELTPDRPELEDLADSLAQYQPGGGDLLFDYSRMKPLVAHHLAALQNR